MSSKSEYTELISGHHPINNIIISIRRKKGTSMNEKREKQLRKFNGTR